MSYHIFEKESVDMICRDYGGDPRVMVIALNGAVSDELRALCEAATVLAAAMGVDLGSDVPRAPIEDARTALDAAAARYAERQLRMARLHGA